jgi:hypothetical protein
MHTISEIVKISVKIVFINYSPIHYISHKKNKVYHYL